MLSSIRVAHIYQTERKFKYGVVIIWTWKNMANSNDKQYMILMKHKTKKKNTYPNKSYWAIKMIYKETHICLKKKPK